MALIRACLIIFGFLALGELVVFLTETKFPSSLIGMFLLTIALHFRWVKVEWVKALSDFLLNNLGLFFIPSCVAIMLYFDVIGQNIVAIMVSIVISTALVIWVTGRVYQYIRKKMK
ncbi:CidA/LrgA family protein [Riemerella columbina]|uniref:CidA/LrgA family protein n=1 Tax=Riemerella columbina TaxID=103810 RepID=UPI00266F3E17|nr:CidA/LrgA family protein [Riemerella columbina]WKS94813.1 CidA/LrgA family protein [Riemerella columbina]